MAYSEDFRKRVNEYLDEGHTWAETQKTFKISLTAISSWRKKYQETGDVKDAPPRRKAFRKLDPDKLRSYVEEHPDAYLKEIGAAFGCSDTAVLKAFRRLKITRKKRPNAIGNRGWNRQRTICHKSWMFPPIKSPMWTKQEWIVVCIGSTVGRNAASR